ncbi:amino acid deaminase [Fodinicola acaciae]|uniref:amino acid deaminase n=1 Tax=Fodinicola acaciae TaxID=2681555 RepID=UPI0013D4A1F7|nr:amino acid deaminase [Fodinicola acaciae]
MRTASYEQLIREPIDAQYKGFPATDTTHTIGTVASAGWQLTDFMFPVLVLKQEPLEHNLKLMADWCAEHNVSLAPHGKTPMAPQLFLRQLDAGAWGVTAATTSQARIMRSFGVRRIILANELVNPAALRWVGQQLDADPEFEMFCLVDSSYTVDRMTALLAGVRRQLPVFLEVGMPAGRAGVRDHAEALKVAASIAASPALRLAGVEAFEGVAGSNREPQTLAEVDDVLSRMVELLGEIDKAGHFDGDEIVFTAGGSSYFDRVVAAAERIGTLSKPVRTVLRSGCYLTHDHGSYEVTSPLRAGQDGPSLQPALEVWGEVLSTPEPGRAIVGFGKRDVPYDQTLPTPLTWTDATGTQTGVAGRATVEKLNDQHAYLSYADLDIKPGDLLSFGISHPCTAFDKWRLIPVVDAGYRVVDAVRTFF